MREKILSFLTLTSLAFGLSGCPLQGELKSIVISPQTTTLAAGQTLTLQAFGGSSDGQVNDVTDEVEWKVTDPSILEITAPAQIRALRTGTASVSATAGKASATLEISVTDAKITALAITPTSAVLPLGTTQVLHAVATFSNGQVSDVTTQARWETSDSATVSVTTSGTAAGTLTTRKAGNVTLRAIYAGETTSLEVHVTAAALSQIVIQSGQTLIPRGTATPLQAMGLYSDGSMLDISSSVLWSTADHAVAVVENFGPNKGLLTATGTGLTQVTATDTVTMRSGSLSMGVSTAELVRIELTHPGLTVSSLNSGDTVQMRATGVYSDASTADLTSLVVWSSSATSIATVSPSGEVRGRGVGSVEITATFGTTITRKTFQIFEPILSSISIVGPSTGLRFGDSFALQAYAIYSDGSSQNITSRVTWASGGPSSALLILQDPGMVGQLWMGRALTPTAITATMGGIVGTATIPTLNTSPAFYTTRFGLANNPVNKRTVNWISGRIDYGGPLGPRELAPISTLVVTNTSSTAVIAQLQTAPGSRGLIYLDGPTGGTATVTCTFPFGMGTSSTTITLP